MRREVANNPISLGFSLPLFSSPLLAAAGSASSLFPLEFSPLGTAGAASATGSFFYFSSFFLFLTTKAKTVAKLALRLAIGEMAMSDHIATYACFWLGIAFFFLGLAPLFYDWIMCVFILLIVFFSLFFPKQEMGLDFSLNFMSY